jgi:RNA polymerase sigma-70 factor (ECF subfamily)
LKAWIWKVTRNSESLEDLCQEVYVRLLRVSPQAVTRITSVKGYARGIAQHVALDWINQRRASCLQYIENIDDIAMSTRFDELEETVTRGQQILLLVTEMRRLPRRCRRILLLVKIYGHTAKEAAARLGIEESTVKNQLQIAAKRCQLALEDRQSRPGLLLLSRLLGRYRGAHD